MKAFNQGSQVKREAEFKAGHLTSTARELGAFYDSYQRLTLEYTSLYEAFSSVMSDFELLNKSQEFLSYSLNHNVAKIQVLVGAAMEGEELTVELVDELAALATIVTNLHIFLNDEAQFAAIADEVDSHIIKAGLKLSKHKGLLK